MRSFKKTTVWVLGVQWTRGEWAESDGTSGSLGSTVRGF